VAKSVEVAVEEEMPAVCDYCEKPEPDYSCTICNYSFHAACRGKHRSECYSKLRQEIQYVECSVEDCWEAVLAFYCCPICEQWFCRRHIRLHIEEELDKAEVEVEEE